MAHTGYVTNRKSLETIISKIASSGKPVPNIELIDKINEKFRVNRWNLAPRYYSHLLSVLRQHILWSCKTSTQTKAGIERVQKAWDLVQQLPAGSADGSSVNSRESGNGDIINNDAEGGASLLPHSSPYYLEVAALRIQCLVAAGSRGPLNSRPFGEIKGEGEGDGDGEGYLQEAVEAYHMLCKYHVSEGDEEVATSSEGGNKEDGVYANTKDQNQNHVSHSRAAGAIRSATRDLLLALAERGEEDEVARVLEIHLSHLTFPGSGNGNGNGSTSQSSQFSQSPPSSYPLGPLQARLWGAADAEWAEGLFGEAMVALSSSPLKHTKNNKDSDSNSSNSSNSSDADQGNLLLSRSRRLESFRLVLKTMAQKRSLPLGASFQASRVRALGRFGFNSAIQLEQAAFSILDSLEDEYGRSPSTYGAMVSALCEFANNPSSAERGVGDGTSSNGGEVQQQQQQQQQKDSRADEDGVSRALKVVYQMIAEKIGILPETWCALLEGGTRTLSDERLQALLTTTEEVR